MNPMKRQVASVPIAHVLGPMVAQLKFPLGNRNGPRHMLVVDIKSKVLNASNIRRCGSLHFDLTINRMRIDDPTRDKKPGNSGKNTNNVSLLMAMMMEDCFRSWGRS